MAEDFSFDDLIQKQEDITSIDSVVGLYGKGHTTKEIKAILEERGAVVKESFLEEVKERFSQQILETYYANAKDLVRRVPRANKFVRVKTLDALLEKFETLIDFELDQGNLSGVVVKAFDAVLKGRRLLAEETNDIQPMQRNIVNVMNIIEQLPREERKRMTMQIQELRRMVLESASKGQEEEEIVDVEFNAEGEESTEDS